MIDHGNGEYSLYAHLQPGSVHIRVGDRISTGAQLGRLGSSGNSTLSHTTVWTESFDQAREDLLGFQAQVVAKAVDKIRVALDARKPGAGDIDDVSLAYLKAQEIVRQDERALNLQAHDLYVELVARADTVGNTSTISLN
jgi:Peptidase family M23